jgi:hypothetical protein
MIKNYLTIAWRNLWKNKVFSPSIFLDCYWYGRLYSFHGIRVL